MRTFIIIFISIITSSISSAQGIAYSLTPLPWKKNMLQNGDAESIPEFGKIFGWNVDTTVVTTLPYGSGENTLPPDTNKYISKGANYFRFSGVNDSTDKFIRQEVSLLSMYDSIKKGNVIFFLSGEIGGQDSIPGKTILSVTFYNNKGMSVGQFSTKPVGVIDRKGITRLVHREIRDTIPNESVKAIIQLKTSRGEKCPPFPDTPCKWISYADNINFYLIPPLGQKNKTITTKAVNTGSKP